MLKLASAIAVSLFVVGATPVAAYNDCFHGCVVNCMKAGLSAEACSDICQDTACPYSAPTGPLE